MDTSNNQNKSITSISNKVEFPVISFRYNIMNEWYLKSVKKEDILALNKISKRISEERRKKIISENC